MKIVARSKRIRVLSWATPLIDRIDRVALARKATRSNRSAMAVLERSGVVAARQILAALDKLQHGIPQPDAARIARVEAERTRLLQIDTPLNDCSLPEPGVFDSGHSVAEACSVSKPPAPAALLYLLIREFKPTSVIELGTNVGISSAFIASALDVNGDAGRLVTMDVSPYRLHHARQVHCNLALPNIDYVEGFFADTLTRTLQNMKRVDFAFIDGHHQYQPTLDYFDQIAAHAIPGTVFVFDDIRWSDGMKQAWEVLQNDERFSLVVDLSSVGLCVLRGAGDQERAVTSRLRAW